MNTDFKPYEADWLDSFTPPIPEIYGEAVSYLQQIRKLYIYVKESVRRLTERLKWLEQNIFQISSEAGKKAALEQLSYINSELNHLSDLLNYRYTYITTEMRMMRQEYTQEYNRSYALSRRALAKSEEIENNLPFMVSEEVKNHMFAIKLQIDTLSRTVSTLDSQVLHLNRLFMRLEGNFLQFKLDVHSIIAKDFKRLEDMIEDQIAHTNANSLLVTSAITGKTVTLKTALDELVRQDSFFQLRASDFDGMKKTVHTFDKMYNTAHMFDSYGGLIFFQELNFPPVYDTIESVKNELQQQIDKINDTAWWSPISLSYLSPYMCYQELVEFVLSRTALRKKVTDFDLEQFSVLYFDSQHITAKAFDVSGSTS